MSKPESRSETNTPTPTSITKSGKLKRLAKALTIGMFCLRNETKKDFLPCKNNICCSGTPKKSSMKSRKGRGKGKRIGFETPGSGRPGNLEEGEMWNEEEVSDSFHFSILWSS